MNTFLMRAFDLSFISSSIIILEAAASIQPPEISLNHLLSVSSYTTLSTQHLLHFWNTYFLLPFQFGLYKWWCVIRAVSNHGHAWQCVFSSSARGASTQYCLVPNGLMQCSLRLIVSLHSHPGPHLLHCHCLFTGSLYEQTANYFIWNVIN